MSTEDPMVKVRFYTGHMFIDLELPSSAVTITADSLPHQPLTVELDCSYWPGNIGEPTQQLLLRISQDLVGNLTAPSGSGMGGQARAFTEHFADSAASVFKTQVIRRWDAWVKERHNGR